MKIFANAIPAVLFPAAFLTTATAARAQEMPAAGTAAPEFTLHSQEGKTVSLKDFRGKWVVLYFYPKDMTQGCTIEARNFQRDLAQYDQKNAVILGVSVDSVDSHQQFCTKESLTFRLLSDSERAVTEKYGSLSPSKMASRNTFLIDPKGMIRKTYSKVNPSAHSQEILTDLAALEKSSSE